MHVCFLNIYFLSFVDKMKCWCGKKTQHNEQTQNGRRERVSYFPILRLCNLIYTHCHPVTFIFVRTLIDIMLPPAPNRLNNVTNFNPNLWPFNQVLTLKHTFMMAGV